MTATGHALIGALIAAKIGNPVLAVPIAIASHLVADAFPHWDAGTNAKKKSNNRLIFDAALDVIISFILSYLIFHYIFPQTNLIYGFTMVLISQGFDWLTMPYYFFGIKLPPFTWAYHFQKNFDNRLDKPWGVINQVAVLVLLIAIAKYF